MLFSKLKFHCVLMLSLFFYFPAVFSDPKNPNLTIHHWTLKNKAQVYFVQRTQIPMLDVAVIFSAGSVYDGNKNGLASLTSAMIGVGTKELSEDKIINQFEQIGAQFDRFTSRDMTTINLRTVTQQPQMNKAISLFKSVILHPSFPSMTLNRIKTQLMTAIKLQEEDPWQIAKNTFYKSLYEKFGYANNPLGNVQTVPHITRKDLLDFYHRFYCGNNADLILVGDISIQQAKDISEHILGAFPQGKKAPQLTLPKTLSVSTYKHIKLPVNQSTIMLGQLGIASDNPNYFPLLVGNAVFGSLPLSSILFNEVREKRGFAYTASSAFYLLKYRGPFVVALQTQTKNTNAALQLVNQLLLQYQKEGPTQAQLDEAKKNLIGYFPLSIASNSDILGVLSRIAFYHLPLNYMETYRDKINAVSLSEVKEAFANTIQLNHFLIVTVGPENLKMK